MYSSRVFSDADRSGFVVVTCARDVEMERVIRIIESVKMDMLFIGFLGLRPDSVVRSISGPPVSVERFCF